ncbi:DUF938 domain-containing protein [Thalassotalea euphylliae]|uniref:DUF938 domain-containing protein n=1 Tax=Thalassotalea euphylliae TaxID=1655234 RepID=UPI003636D76A
MWNFEENWHHFAPSCERNKQVIYEALSSTFQEKTKVLEIGSYSGQHAVHFVQKLPQLSWQCSDIAQMLPGLHENLVLHGRGVFKTPIEIDVSDSRMWPDNTFELIYTANTFHIMSQKHVEQCFKNLPKVCESGTVLAVYGPFNYDGEYTSESNADFDIWLKERDSQSAIRDFEQVNNYAESAGFRLQSDLKMPANNQLILWQFT